ncbi:MAG: class I SAM-dependent methyltransferase [Deltaproteobacteria bacterium]|nr:class I SAM-dependent methyltransferase [Deltaproteobacteria bacterium]
MSVYSDFGELYDAWIGGSELAQLNQAFYLAQYAGCVGDVVELGVGNGRILLEAAEMGVSCIGIDSCAELLAQCKTSALARGLANKLSLQLADFRSFTLERPAELISIPWHSFQHLLDHQAQSQTLSNIFHQLEPGGRLIFDTFRFDDAFLASASAQPGCRSVFTDSCGQIRQLWTDARGDKQRAQVVLGIWTDAPDSRRIELALRWTTAQEIETLLHDQGFELIACYDGYFEQPRSAATREEIWIAERSA